MTTEPRRPRHRPMQPVDVPPSLGAVTAENETTQSTEPRLYGLPGAEYLHSELSDAISELRRTNAQAGIIEVWTVEHNRKFLPDADQTLEMILEHTVDNEVCELLAEEFWGFRDDPGALAMLSALLDHISDNVRRCQAGDLLGSYTVVLDETTTQVSSIISTHPSSGPVVQDL